MAKKKKEKLIPEGKIQESSIAIEARNLQRIEYYVALGNVIYDDFIEELAKIASRLPFGLKSLKSFSFDDFPIITARVNQMIKETTFKVVTSIAGGVDDAFLRANAKNDALVDAVFKGTGIPKRKLARYYNRNLEAGLTRTTKSQLSKNVYKITKQFKQIAEASIDSGIVSGKSAMQLAADIRKAVKDPTPLFRRVRVTDKNGKTSLELSKGAIEYRKKNPANPGQYYSPVRNYQRLTRSEINMAYRVADQNRMDSLDFIVGKRQNLSTNPNHCVICISLQGVYPKDYLFRSIHPQCRCYITSILKTREEMDRDNELILSGKDPLEDSVNRVTDIPNGMKEWLIDNSERIKGMEKRGTLPYFLQDNFKKGNYTPSGRIPGKIVGGLEAK